MNSIKHTISMIDAFLMNKQLGTLVVDDGQAFLELAIGELITLNESYEIEVISDGKYYPITYNQAINTMSTDGWSLYAGLDCRIRKIA
ncbi:hypothetical protein [Heyndrickxia ginsengihumi]|uniref:hypothetical protein n=1 Tax=Heyndrickxia ginsengihumi TaxID=363870 RepID=UPI00046F10D6|nr:hypothetical protein [Heyndrickxia ginsengihumi]